METNNTGAKRSEGDVITFDSVKIDAFFFICSQLHAKLIQVIMNASVFGDNHVRISSHELMNVPSLHAR